MLLNLPIWNQVGRCWMFCRTGRDLRLKSNSSIRSICVYGGSLRPFKQILKTPKHLKDASFPKRITRCFSKPYHRVFILLQFAKSVLDCVSELGTVFICFGGFFVQLQRLTAASLWSVDTSVAGGIRIHFFCVENLRLLLHVSKNEANTKEKESFMQKSNRNLRFTVEGLKPFGQLNMMMWVLKMTRLSLNKQHKNLADKKLKLKSINLEKSMRTVM